MSRTSAHPGKHSYLSSLLCLRPFSQEEADLAGKSRQRRLAPLSISAERDRAGIVGSHQGLKASGLQAAPLWGLKAGMAIWLSSGVGRLGLRVASKQGLVARAAEGLLLPPFVFSQFFFKGQQRWSLLLTVRGVNFHNQQSSLSPPPSCCPSFVFKRLLAPWVATKTPSPPLRGLCPQDHKHRAHCPQAAPSSESGGGAGWNHLGRRKLHLALGQYRASLARIPQEEWVNAALGPRSLQSHRGPSFLKALEGQKAHGPPRVGEALF